MCGYNSVSIALVPSRQDSALTLQCSLPASLFGWLPGICRSLDIVLYAVLNRLKTRTSPVKKVLQMLILAAQNPVSFDLLVWGWVPDEWGHDINNSQHLLIIIMLTVLSILGTLSHLLLTTTLGGNHFSHCRGDWAFHSLPKVPEVIVRRADITRPGWLQSPGSCHRRYGSSFLALHCHRKYF